MIRSEKAESGPLVLLWVSGAFYLPLLSVMPPWRRVLSAPILMKRVSASIEESCGLSLSLSIMAINFFSTFEYKGSLACLGYILLG